MTNTDLPLLKSNHMCLADKSPRVSFADVVAIATFDQSLLSTDPMTAHQVPMKEEKCIDLNLISRFRTLRQDKREYWEKLQFHRNK